MAIRKSDSKNRLVNLFKYKHLISISLCAKWVGRQVTEWTDEFQAEYNIHLVIYLNPRDWKYFSVIHSAYCFSGGSRFGSQDTH